ncbi:MAG: hypothetical protein AAGD00_02205 [Planctomycetota bacterium]
MSDARTQPEPHQQADTDAPQDLDAPPVADEGEREPLRHPERPKRKMTLFERAEAFVSKLSTRNNFWHKVCSFIWLPYAFRSGIVMRPIDDNTFTAVLPFTRFNKNWYNAMAGAALLANSEIAGGMYLFKAVGRDYTVVCKELTYRFLRPCYGPAVYRCRMMEPVEEKMATGGEFNLEVQLDIFQGLGKPGQAEKRVGRCKATFHVTPKDQAKARKKRETPKPRDPNQDSADPSKSPDQQANHAA